VGAKQKNAWYNEKVTITLVVPKTKQNLTNKILKSHIYLENTISSVKLK